MVVLQLTITADRITASKQIKASLGMDVDGGLTVDSITADRITASKQIKATLGLVAVGGLTADSLKLGGTAVTATAAELNYLDITTLASKAVTADANGHVKIADGSINFDIASHDGTNGLKLGGVLVEASADQLNYLDINTLGTAQASKAVTAAADGVITIAADKFKYDGTAVTASGAQLNYLDINTLGTSQASKAVTADANGVITVAAGKLNYAGTDVTATGAELNYLDIKHLVQQKQVKLSQQLLME